MACPRRLPPAQQRKGVVENETVKSQDSNSNVEPSVAFSEDKKNNAELIIEDDSPIMGRNLYQLKKLQFQLVLMKILERTICYSKIQEKEVILNTVGVDKNKSYGEEFLNSLYFSLLLPSCTFSFYKVRSFEEAHRGEICLAALFLAAKVHDNSRKVEEASKSQTSLPVVQISMLIPRNLLIAEEIRILQTRLKK
ncbi:hypothetical protein TNIN_16033 [Trichonephila inaurata madagascariensis]|uniref:Uncharacterized protein n=1 Tax=Trichonephila inaurata madagascariensis TaxID=2747483 RepID=A0A8X6Y4J9_9ARAC|nr:hypothetical protein TNIN_16033 [Trichonephila inaurata madagascariensis]